METRVTDVLSFRDLDAWQAAMDLVITTYELCRRFPADEQYGSFDRCGAPPFLCRRTLQKGMRMDLGYDTETMSVSLWGRLAS
jgi:hypothetical protein